MSDQIVLNKLAESVETSATKISSKTLMNSLRIVLTELKSNFIDEKGVVDYATMRNSDEFKRYRELAQQLNYIDLVRKQNKFISNFQFKRYQSIAQELNNIDLVRRGAVV